MRIPLTAAALIALLFGALTLQGRADASPHGLQVGTHGVVIHSTLPHCAIEDGSSGPLPCSWNFDDTDGNGQGLAFWVGRHHHFHYVWAHSPITGRWHWVSSALADALAEGGTPHADTRNWERCAVKGQWTIKCPDGLRINA